VEHVEVPYDLVGNWRNEVLHYLK